MKPEDWEALKKALRKISPEQRLQTLKALMEKEKEEHIQTDIQKEIMTAQREIEEEKKHLSSISPSQLIRMAEQASTVLLPHHESELESTVKREEPLQEETSATYGIKENREKEWEYKKNEEMQRFSPLSYDPSRGAAENEKREQERTTEMYKKKKSVT